MLTMVTMLTLVTWWQNGDSGDNCENVDNEKWLQKLMWSNAHTKSTCNANHNYE